MNETEFVLIYTTISNLKTKNRFVSKCANENLLIKTILLEVSATSTTNKLDLNINR